jgi:polar amino acid transport system substrate-binding protein
LHCSPVDRINYLQIEVFPVNRTLPNCLSLRILRLAGVFAGILLPAVILVAAHCAALAQPAAPGNGEALNVGTRVVPPFVIEQDGKLQGFSIDLWQALATEMGKRSVISKVDTLRNLLDSVEQKKVDLAIAAISITAAREEKFDFSQPMFDSGLQIMVRSDGNDGGFSFTALKSLLSSGPMPALLTILGLLILVPAHIVWLAERNQPGSIIGRSYFPGIFNALWWATGAAHGQQLDYPRSAVGRAVSALTIFISVIFIALFTASITTALTVQQLKGDINGPEDLPGKRVATVSGSTATAYLRNAGVAFSESPGVSGATQQLLDKQVDAVVFDSPVLLYFAAQEGRGKVNVVGPLFRKEAYGILFPQDSTLRKPVNEALLKLRENGVYDTLYRKWFAKDDAKAN